MTDPLWRGHWWAELPPAAGAAVMATAVLSVGLGQAGAPSASAGAFALAAVAWAVLAADFLTRLFGDRPRFVREAGTPAALTAIAATGVLGVRLSTAGRQDAAAFMLLVVALCWPWLMYTAVRHRVRRAPGAVFLLCVAVQCPAVLAADLGAATGRPWLERVALAAFCLGLLAYADALARFDFREVARGAGDQWVAGGALCISALAASTLAGSPLWTGAAHTALRTTALVLLGLGLGGCAALAAAEVRWPRPRYDVRRWATAFPVGVAAVATTSVAAVTGVGWLRGAGTVLLGAAVAVWLLTAAGAVRRVRAAARRRRRRRRVSGPR
ncbi:hypothetical protein [Streptomyces sp. NPDC012888]|uniref:SLAC1 family transporter n=1 Tax=Streptomyces sp. NPDC012888 TaxID=3364855 RepID=UPI0036A8CAD4